VVFGWLSSRRAQDVLAQESPPWSAWLHFRIVDLAQTKKKSTEAGNFAGGVPI